jgi:thiaminase/transcriptional activator TenA
MTPMTPMTWDPLPGEGFARTLREENAAIWEAMQTHRFVTDIMADRLDPLVFRRYLIFEHGFVETAILIFGHAMLKAPAFSQRRRLIGVLHSLAEEQLTYFAAVFRALGLAPDAATQAMPQAVRRFDGGMLAIAASGSYAEILTIMLAAEWMYGSWCLRAAKTNIGEPALRDWVLLHTEPGFLDQVAWLMGEIDREAAGLDEAARHRLSALFRAALELEVTFHEAAYKDWPVPMLEDEV